MKPSRWTVCAAALLAVLGARAAVAAEVTLSAVNFVPNTQAFGAPFAEWVEQVNKEGKGLVRIDLKAAGSMSPFKMGEAIKSGAVDMGNVPATFYQNLLPVGEAIKLTEWTPKGPDDPEPALAFLNELHHQKVNAEYLATWFWGVKFHLYLRDKQIAEPSLAGLKMRVTPIYRAFFRELGAEVVQTPPGEVYTALERGTVDGYGWPLWDIKTPGWDKVTKYRVEPGFYTVTSGIIVNLDKWKSLSKEQQDFLRTRARQFAWEEFQRVDEKNARFRKEQADAGVQVIELQGPARETFLKTAYEAGWEEHMKLDPENAKKLRELFPK